MLSDDAAVKEMLKALLALNRRIGKSCINMSTVSPATSHLFGN
jgi:3-hydroxyisobutyrate dehydrogenase-like beta-hydroxyacid dehydrogenase